MQDTWQKPKLTADLGYKRGFIQLVILSHSLLVAPSASSVVFHDTAGSGRRLQDVRKYYQLVKSAFVPKICGDFWDFIAVLQGLPSICQ